MKKVFTIVAAASVFALCVSCSGKKEEAETKAPAPAPVESIEKIEQTETDKALNELSESLKTVSSEYEKALGGAKKALDDVKNAVGDTSKVYDDAKNAYGEATKAYGDALKSLSENEDVKEAADALKSLGSLF